MKEIILIKNGELVLKGLNRNMFEDKLIKNIKRRLYGLGEISIDRSQSTMTIEPKSDEYDYDEACNRLSKIFGIAGLHKHTRRTY